MVHHYQGSHDSLENLIASIFQAFWDYPSENIQRAYAIYLQNSRQVLEIKGGNEFRLSHTNIRKRQQESNPIVDFSIPTQSVLNGIEFLRSKHIHFQIDQMN